jgi:magnesium-transporting ATPase (P-type)
MQGGDKTEEICQIEQLAPTALSLLHGAAKSRQQAKPSTIPPEARMFVFRNTRFLFSGDVQCYRQINLEELTTTADAHNGLSDAQAAALLSRCGQNVIDIPIPAWPILLMRECIHPFVIFQVWAVIVWLTEAYYSFSAFIFVAAIATAVMNFWEVRKNLLDIQQLSKFTTQVEVRRSGHGA